MHIVRYADDDTARVGVLTDDGQTRRLEVGSIAELLGRPLAQLRETVEAAAAGGTVETGTIRSLPPVDGLTEVWAAGVTYRTSSEARQEESAVADVYSRIYDAPRPELFFKSPAWRVCGDGEPIGVRADSPINVAEPELALVINSGGEVIGVSICNDVSSRSIEGENPLYLPQAKVYSGACALGPSIRPIWEIADLGALDISLVIRRAGEVTWHGRTSTSMLHRTMDDLVEHLRRFMIFPDGAVLSTGTGIVPEMTFSLQPGDVAEVGIQDVGTLRNEVRSATGAEFGWLTPDPARSPR